MTMRKGVCENSHLLTRWIAMAGRPLGAAGLVSEQLGVPKGEIELALSWRSSSTC